MTRSILLGILMGLLSLPASATSVTGGETPQAVVVEDFNGDGREDLAFANAFDDTVTVHLQNSLGSFPLTVSLNVGIHPGTQNDFPRYLNISDINRDGLSDLIVLCSGDTAFGFEPSIQTIINLGSGLFAALDARSTAAAQSSEEFPVQFSLGEFTGDHYTDAAIANLDGLSIRVMEGNGTGLYKVGQAISINTMGDGPQGIIVRDVDGNGFDDIFVVTASAFLFIGQSSPGVFEAPVQFALPAANSDLRAALVDDLDGDGDLDAALADAVGRIHLLFGVSPGGALESSRVEESPSLSGCSDVAVVYWDGDARPDIAVTNRTGDTVSVLLSTGGFDVIPTGDSPRRLGVGDLDGNGRLDLVTANEGDLSDPDNPDGSVVLNPGSQITTLMMTLLEETSLDPLFASQVPHPAGLSAPPSGNRIWMIENSRRSMRETGDDGDLLRQLQFSFEVGGAYFKESSEGWIVERYSSTIREFEIEGKSSVEFESKESFDRSPGALGFCGLAYNSETEQFFVSDPENERILRINREGEVVGEITVSPAAWGLAWDKETHRLFVTNPGRSDVRAFTSSGTPDLSRSFDLDSTSAIFHENGLAGIAIHREDHRLFLITTAGLLLKTTFSGSVRETSPWAPFSETIGLDVDNRNGDYYTLSQDGFVKKIPYPELSNPQMLPLWPALEADPSFLPAGIAVDENTGKILVGDRHRALLAQFTPTGDFEGFADFSGTVEVGMGPIRAVEYRSSNDEVCFRISGSVVSNRSSLPLSLPDSPCGDIGVGNDQLVTVLPNPCELMTISHAQTPQIELGLLPAPARRGGLAFDSSGNLVQLETRGAPILRVFSIHQQSAVEGWDLYQ